MDIIIRETGKIETLDITDGNGISWVSDLIGNTGALGDATNGFVPALDADGDELDDVWTCSQETYDWWSQYIEGLEATEAETDALIDDLSAIWTDDTTSPGQMIQDRIGAEVSGNDMDKERAVSQAVLAAIRAEYLPNA